MVILLVCSINAHASQFVLDGIIGGERATTGAWPWQVSVGVGSSARYFHFCGGTLVGAEWVLTAAHCVVNVNTGEVINPNTLLIRAGVTDLADPAAVHAAVTEIIPHEQFEKGGLRNDIALLHLSSPLKCAGCKPIALVLPDQETAVASPGTLATVTGWGDININPSAVEYTTTLMEVEVPIVGNAECASLYQPAVIADEMVCAGWIGVGGKDSCQGDSGGPLVVRRSDGTGFVLEGIVSWGKSCADPGFPGIYTRASSYAAWVGGKVSATSDTGSNGGGGSADLYFLVLTSVFACGRFRRKPRVTGIPPHAPFHWNNTRTD